MGPSASRNDGTLRPVRRAMISAGEDPLQFGVEFFTSPVSIVLLAALAITILSQTALWGKLWGTGKRAGGYAE